MTFLARNFIHFVLTICTIGFWLPVWAIVEAIIYTKQKPVPAR